MPCLASNQATERPFRWPRRRGLNQRTMSQLSISGRAIKGQQVAIPRKPPKQQGDNSAISAARGCPELYVTRDLALSNNVRKATSLSAPGIGLRSATWLIAPAATRSWSTCPMTRRPTPSLSASSRRCTASPGRCVDSLPGTVEPRCSTTRRSARPPVYAITGARGRDAAGDLLRVPEDRQTPQRTSIQLLLAPNTPCHLHSLLGRPRLSPTSGTFRPSGRR